MPPKGKLPDAVIADFEAWISMGAPDPRDGKALGGLRDLLELMSEAADAAGPDCFASARVLLATPDGKVRPVAENMAHPNGLAITSAHEVMVAETLGNRVIAFQMGEDGALLHRRVFANFERMSPLGISSCSTWPTVMVAGSK